MGSRLELNALFKTFTPNVYFQPPRNVQMAFPAIEYHPDYEERKFADNGTYDLMDRYLVTIIDQDPDSPIRESVRRLPLIIFNRWFATEGLNHFIYSLHY